LEDNLTFGQYLKLMIKEKGFTQAEFRRQLKLSKTYLVDIENGDAYPPLKLQMRMMTVLQLGNTQKMEFFDKAAAGRGDLPTDVFLYLLSNREKIRELRSEIYAAAPR
jgi:transcriptional regulator with XRE-family HTH domain